jgi:ABC-2 type transport system permease protein
MNRSTNRSIARVRGLLRVGYREFKRDFGAMFLSFVFPLFFVVALVTTNLMDAKVAFDVAIVDPHGNPDAAALAEALASDNIAFRTLPEAEARQDLRDGKLQAAIVLPERSLREPGAEATLIAEQRFEGFVRMLFEAARARLLLGDGEAAGQFAFRVESFEQQVDSNFSFLYPGMLALALVQLGLFSTATPLLRARERGTLRYLLLTPLTIGEMLAGQIGLRVLIAIVQVTILLVAGMFVLPLAASDWLAVYAVSLLGVLMLVSVGYALAGLPRSLESGMAMIMIANFAMMFGGNIFWDPEAAPVLKIIAHLLPVSYLADMYRQIISGSEGLWPLWLDALALVLWALAALTLAIKTFRFDTTPRSAAAKPAAA